LYRLRRQHSQQTIVYFSVHVAKESVTVTDLALALLFDLAASKIGSTPYQAMGESANVEMVEQGNNNSSNKAAADPHCVAL
jgi:hypothetical protein